MNEPCEARGADRFRLSGPHGRPHKALWQREPCGTRKKVTNSFPQGVMHWDFSEVILW